MLAQALPDVFSDPRAYAALVLVIAAVVQYQRTLGWREYRQYHKLKVRYAPLVSRLTGAFVVSRKGGRSDGEYLTTINERPQRVFQRLLDGGGSPLLVNSVKVREHPDSGTDHYSVAHVVFTHDDGMQTEAYLFDNGDGTTDVYAHFEAGVLSPEEHLEGEQRDGDVRGVVTEALEA